MSQKISHGLNRYARMMIRRYPHIAASWLGAWWYAADWLRVLRISIKRA